MLSTRNAFLWVCGCGKSLSHANILLQLSSCKVYSELWSVYFQNPRRCFYCFDVREKNYEKNKDVQIPGLFVGQPSDGRNNTILVTLTKEWQLVSFGLFRFFLKLLISWDLHMTVSIIFTQNGAEAKKDTGKEQQFSGQKHLFEGSDENG